MDLLKMGIFPVSHVSELRGVYLGDVFSSCPEMAPFQVASKLGNPQLFRYPTGTGLEKNSFSKGENLYFG